MAACAASLESQLWKTAQQADTIGAYEGFLERCPSGDLAPKARDRLQALRETLQGLQTVRVVVDESYTAGPVHAAIEGIKLPFAEATAELLRGVHLEVVFAADVSADGELHVLVEGQALRKTYAPTDERALTTRGALTLQYAGADLRGSMALRTPTGTLYERSFEGRLTPPDRLGSERYPTPGDAPFSPLFETTFLPVATRMVGDLYGAGPLLPILRDGTLASRTAAATALGLLADSTATRDLLEVLETTANFGLKGAIVTALGRIADDRVTPMLTRVLLTAFDVGLRERAAEALGLIDDVTAVDALIEALEKDAASVRLQVTRSLRRITGESWGEDVDAWRRWQETRTGPRR